MPRVSVIMPLYNRADLVRQTLDSIAAQTYSDYEFIIVDDCSSDNSCDVVESCGDKRIKLIRNDRNSGVARTLNRAIEASSGEYLARMDSDDLCTPNRFALQVAHLDKNPDVGILFTQAKSFGDSSRVTWLTPVDPEVMRASFIISHNVAHPTAMMRRSMLDQHNLRYREDSKAEDYDLWTRAIDCFKLTTIPKILFYVRQHDQRLVKLTKPLLNSDADFIRGRELAKLGIDYSPREFELHCMAGNSIAMSKSDLEEFRVWLERIREFNRTANHYRQDALESALAEHWYAACRYSQRPDSFVFSMYRKSDLSRYAGRNMLHRAYRTWAVRRACK